MTSRELETLCQEEPITPGFDQGLVSWFVQRAEQHQMEYFLAIALDGVIWGKFQDGKLHLSSDASFTLKPGEPPERVSPALKEETLIQATAFGAQAELRLWREEAGFRACVLTDPVDPSRIIKDEAWLWGNRDGQDKDFVLMREGEQGLLHAVPYPEVPEKSRLALAVHHIVDYDPQGRAFIAFSRLAGVIPAKTGGLK